MLTSITASSSLSNTTVLGDHKLFMMLQASIAGDPAKYIVLGKIRYLSSDRVRRPQSKLGLGKKGKQAMGTSLTNDCSL
jgi:hypothetical protein